MIDFCHLRRHHDNHHNDQVHDVITFEAEQSELEYEMEIVDDDEWEPDEEFYVKVFFQHFGLDWIYIQYETIAQ